MVCGMTAGSLGQLAASPTDLIKVRMQMEGRRRLEGKPPRWDFVNFLVWILIRALENSV